MEAKVADAMIEVLGRSLNASSPHKMGRMARTIVEDARRKIAEFVGCGDDYNVIFTSSGTEANNLALKGFDGQNLFVSEIEHPSVLNVRKKPDSIVIPVNEDGTVNIENLEKLLTIHRGKSLVSVMLANNETGIIQPIKEVVEVSKKWGAAVHTDAVQCFGKVKVDIKELGVDMLTISAHKFGGPQGVAALIVKKDIQLVPQTIGGGQEQNKRGGTENIAAIHGFGKAVEIARVDEGIEFLRDALESEIRTFAPECIIFGENKDRLPNTSFIAMPDVSSETQLIHFDMNDIAVSAGSACSSGKIETSHVLKAMGVNDKIASCAVRVSLGRHSTAADINLFVRVWKELYNNVKNKAEKVA
jgi:cysteine desulfurase